MNITSIEERGNTALAFLTDTDEKAAELKQAAERAEHAYNSTVDIQFLAHAGNVEERKANARRCAEPKYVEYLEAQLAYDKVQNRRRSESIVIEWCRSLYSNYKQGK
jgi:hypothetical protein